MNDLRSRNRALAAVPDEGSAPTSTPPRVRPEPEESGRRMSRRQSIAERARRAEEESGSVVAAAGSVVAAAGSVVAEVGNESTSTSTNDHKFKSSRPAAEEEALSAEADPVAEDEDDDESKGPSSRPNRRREVSEESEEVEDRFPWHFQFDDDEPEELQASSPLLSRAFRATIG